MCRLASQRGVFLVYFEEKSALYTDAPFGIAFTSSGIGKKHLEFA